MFAIRIYKHIISLSITMNLQKKDSINVMKNCIKSMHH